MYNAFYRNIYVKNNAFNVNTEIQKNTMYVHVGNNNQNIPVYCRF